jgi:hypothetical protein
MAYDGDDPTCLVGEQLNMVCFVMDYVEFHFNGPILRALTSPIVSFPDGSWQFPGAGSRDALCRLIGTEVESVDVSRDKIELVMYHGAQLVIQLGEASRRGPEAAHYVPARADGSLRVSEMITY